MLGWAPEQGLEGKRVGPEHKSQHLSDRGEMEEKPFHNGPQWNSSCKEWKYRQKSGGFTYSRLAARDGIPGNLPSCSKKFHVFHPLSKFASKVEPKWYLEHSQSRSEAEKSNWTPFSSEDPEGDQVEMFDPFFSIFLPISKLSQIEDLPMSPLLADKSAHFPGRHPHLYHPPLLHSCHEENIKRKG